MEINDDIKRNFIRICRCGQPIIIMKHNQFKKLTPFNLDLTRHSVTCPYREKPLKYEFTQRDGFVTSLKQVKSLDEAMDNEALEGRY